MVSKGTQDLLVNLGIVVLVIVVIYVVIIRNPNALNWLKGTGRKTGAVFVGAASVPFTKCPSSSNPHRAQWCASHECLASGEEAGGYVTITQIDNENEEISIKFRGGKHNDDCPDSGSCYILGLKFDGSVNAQYEEPQQS